MAPLPSTERPFRQKYEEEGYDIIHKGIPDFILLKKGELRFVEVKSKGDQLNPFQRRAIKLLRKHKIKTEVVGPGAPRRRIRKIEKRRCGNKLVVKYKCLTRREQEVLEALRERVDFTWENAVYLAATDLGITESAVHSCISRVRKKLDDALKARRRYREILKRKR